MPDVNSLQQVGIEHWDTPSRVALGVVALFVVFLAAGNSWRRTEISIGGWIAMATVAIILPTIWFLVLPRIGEFDHKLPFLVSVPPTVLILVIAWRKR